MAIRTGELPTCFDIKACSGYPLAEGTNMGHDGRVILASNRLPVKTKVVHGRIELEPSVGGLATGLRRPHERGGLWIGWPGDASRLDLAQRASLDQQLAARRLAAVHLTAAEVQRYYEGYANAVLWPLLHAMPSRMPLESRDWDAYVDANTRFADAVAARWKPGDLVWVHDYHLLLVPQLLRERVPHARVGLFLHVPFPPSDVFRVLPRRAEVLRGLLGADLLGFQTFADQRNFLASVLRVLGHEADYDRFEIDGREVRAGVFPIGVDFETFAKDEQDAAIARELARGPRSREVLVLGVDRLDYTKGIPRRLLAFERLLERHPRWRGRARMIQVSVPTREGVSAYRELRRQVDELVGRVNGEWSTIGWVPVQTIHRSFDEAQLRALYRAVDVMLVSPLRDGMNLVAKEFVAARTDERGVLVLSEFAGASAELPEAVSVNPHDVDGMADALDHALAMSEGEQASRMRAMRTRLRGTDVHAWAEGFVDALASGAEVAARVWTPAPPFATVASAPALALLLDYDGTLVPLAADPGSVGPDEALTTLLAELAALPGVDVHIMSGRDAATLQRWLGGLAVHLHAEHGASHRPPGGEWACPVPGLGALEAPVRDAMNAFALRTPGAFVEEKALGLAWHYRRADAEHGAASARELRHHLHVVLANAPVEVIAGAKVVEVRPHGVSKALAVQRALTLAPGAAIVAFGDDRTDDDAFAALPEGSLAVGVGERPVRAHARVGDSTAVRVLLARVLEVRRALPSERVA
jgi:trehalose 6-phosphate synthase/phosphatase